MLKGDGITENVRQQIYWKLRRIAQNCDITNPEEVRQYIANAKHHKTNQYATDTKTS